MTVEGLDCFNQKPSSIVTSVFFITNRPLGAQFILDECIALWVLKNSSAGRGPKLRRVRMPYKRFSRVAWAFSIPQNHAVFVDGDFFNTHP